MIEQNGGMTVSSSTGGLLRVSGVVLSAGLGLIGAAAAQPADRLLSQLAQVGVDEHLDTRLPLDLQFVDETGRTVRLGQYFDGSRPLILTLNYYECPMLCGLQLNGLAQGLKGVDWTIGDRFDVVTVSINPSETPTLARQKRQSYLSFYDRDGAASAWHFLTGQEADIRRLANTVGFHYAYDPQQKQYAHPAVLFVCTPDGRVARYLYGVEFPPKSLRLALLEASEGKMGNPLDRIVLYCYHYDPSSHRYAPVAMNIMRVGGGATVLLLGLSLGIFWFRDSRRKRGEDPTA